MAVEIVVRKMDYQKFITSEGIGIHFSLGHLFTFTKTIYLSNGQG